ncbi:MAG: hypothetical protein WCC92_01400 [Candidatus Korobacteraceae bacterium]
MKGEESEQMLSLLKELSVFKALDEGYQAGPKSRVEIEAHEERERRRREIKLEMQTLSAESKSDSS